MLPAPDKVAAGFIAECNVRSSHRRLTVLLILETISFVYSFASKISFKRPASKQTDIQCRLASRIEGIEACNGLFTCRMTGPRLFQETR